MFSSFLFWTDRPEEQSTWFFWGLQWNPVTVACGGSQPNKAPLHWLSSLPLPPTTTHSAYFTHLSLPSINNYLHTGFDSKLNFSFTFLKTQATTKAFGKDDSNDSMWFKKKEWCLRRKACLFFMLLHIVLIIWCSELWKRGQRITKEGTYKEPQRRNLDIIKLPNSGTASFEFLLRKIMIH